MIPIFSNQELYKHIRHELRLREKNLICKDCNLVLSRWDDYDEQNMSSN